MLEFKKLFFFFFLKKKWSGGECLSLIRVGLDRGMIPRLLGVYINRQFLINVRHILRSFVAAIQTSYDLVTMSNPKSESVSEPSVSEPPPSQPSVPISYPIKTLEELESRSYFDSFHYPFNRASVPILNGDSSSLPQRRRLLVCHDMAGGYLDDKWIQGGTNPDAYAIWHWHLIDVFVYFSHSLVTLPPPSWTNTAHRHGVKVLCFNNFLLCLNKSVTFLRPWNLLLSLTQLIIRPKLPDSPKTITNH